MCPSDRKAEQVIIEGAEIAWGVAGVIIGAVARRRRPKRRHVEPGPVCQCTHGYAFHDPETGRCGYVTVRFTTRETVIRDADDDPVLDSWGDVQTATETTDTVHTTCGCMRYTGPQPLPEVVAL
jgi:hypothetical protein